MKLTKRLLAIATLVPFKSVVADIGSDHGQLLIYLKENDLILKGYGVENKIGPFSRLKKSLAPYQNNDLIPVFSDGLNNLSEDVNCLVLAGIGGETIMNILEKGKKYLKNIRHIIVDAHTLVSEVRQFIVKNHFQIKEEILVYEKKQFYEIILFEKVQELKKYSFRDYEYGPYIMKSPLFSLYVKEQIIKIDELLEKDLPLENKRLLLKKRKELEPYANNSITAASR